MTDPNGVNLLPACGEWIYDTLPRRATTAGAHAPVVLNLNAAPTGARTDYSIALDQLQAAYPGCTTIALVVAWFGNSTDVAQCQIYPATNFSGGTTEALMGGTWANEPWRCSGLTQASGGLIPLTISGGDAVYGGTPSDPAVVRCLRDLKARGLRTVFYPFLLMDAPGFPWRGRIGLAGADVSLAASAAVAAFLGNASPAQFTRDTTNLTVGYSGASTDYTYRRMILHYANLCVIAGGVDLFLLGSELRGLESIRGPGWTKAGTLTGAGAATWDYPFVAGLTQLASDVRGIFDAAALPRDTSGLHNLIAYSADWSSWMGVQHPGADGQWPHLDALYASDAIDLVSFDNYLPLSDWTTGGGGLDSTNWASVGLPGAPTLASKVYLKANIEGGERFDWFYADGDNLGRGADPVGSGLQVSRPAGDRLTQSRQSYAANQQVLAQKQIRWWWNNPHHAIYDAIDGQGWVPHGAATAWVPQSKSITFAEYGFPTVDRCTNQPNVFYDAKSTESATPYWSIWDPAAGDTFAPRRDDLMASLGREALVEYWTVDGHNATSAAGVRMIEPTFMSAWNWDARPFPAFPQLAVWGDAPNWATGTWIDGKGPVLPPAPADAAPVVQTMPTFPTLTSEGWSRTYRPLFATVIAGHSSGRETRAGREATPDWEIMMRFDVLSDAVTGDIATLAGFYATRRGAALPFLVPMPADLELGPTLACRFAEDQLDQDEFAAHLIAIGELDLRSVRVLP